MIARIKKAWHEFTARAPGKRFVEMYDEHQAARKSTFVRVGYMALAVAIIAIGIVALPMPGPGTLVLAFGFAMIARESLWLARLMDRAELKVRDLWRRFRKRRKPA